MESPPVLVPAAQRIFFFPVIFELESASRSEDTHSAARLRWQSATIRIERTERRKKCNVRLILSGKVGPRVSHLCNCRRANGKAVRPKAASRTNEGRLGPCIYVFN